MQYFLIIGYFLKRFRDGNADETDARKHGLETDFGFLDVEISQNTQKAQKNHDRKLVELRASELKFIETG